MSQDEVFAVQAGAQLAALDWIFSYITGKPQEQQNLLAVEYLITERSRTRTLLDRALARLQATGRKAASRRSTKWEGL
jgi:hypothetical protein